MARKKPARRRRRRTTRRNPDLMKMLTGGVRNAGFLLAGEAATRALPGVVGFPTTGAAGPLMQATAAVAVGFLADRALGADAGAQVLAGGLAVPMRRMIAGAGVPVLSAALTPAPLGGGVYSGRMSAGTYPTRALPRPAARPATMAGGVYPTRVSAVHPYADGRRR